MEETRLVVGMHRDGPRDLIHLQLVATSHVKELTIFVTDSCVSLFIPLSQEVVVGS